MSDYIVPQSDCNDQKCLCINVFCVCISVFSLCNAILTAYKSHKCFYKDVLCVCKVIISLGIIILRVFIAINGNVPNSGVGLSMIVSRMLLRPGERADRGRDSKQVRARLQVAP
ncbi:MAG: hypothetical protein KJ578_04065 [Bacteroidetes bacterium]|nr:hypothetical protein [Bacteroidota bacterium]MBU1579912.1 hypothetical protein [Bacteroidota bacterium]MBU2556937.1 hypothetical protein [Bacteroidota bacterium]